MGEVTACLTCKFYRGCECHRYPPTHHGYPQVREAGAITHTLGPVDGFDVDWEIEQDDYNYERLTGERGRLHGSSALFAALAGVAMGYDRIVLAGCPLDTGGHWYFEPEGPETLGPIWLGVDFAAWIDFSLMPEARKVRSMSGYTARILGTARKTWAK